MPRRTLHTAILLTATLGLLLAHAALPAPAAEIKAGVDAYGDPLPQGARARMGTTRWRHGDVVTYVAFTPDGKTVISASADNTIRMWERATGKEMRRFAGGTSVAASPDGKLLAYVRTAGNAVAICDLATGKELHEILLPRFVMSSLVFSPDSKTLAGRDGDRTIFLWDATTGKEVKQLKKQLTGNLVNIRIGGVEGAGLAFAPDGKMLASAEIDFDNGAISTSVRLFDIAAGKEVRHIKSPQMGVSTVAYSPDSKLVAFNAGTAVQLCETATGKEVRKFEGQHLNGASTIVFAPDGKVLATKGSMEGESLIQLWDVHTGKALQRLGHAPKVPAFGLFWAGVNGTVSRQLAFAPDGKVLAVGDEHNQVRLWDVAAGKELTQGGGHQGSVSALALAPDGKTLLTRGADHTIRLWDTAAGKERKQFAVPEETTCVAFAVDGRTIATGSADGKIHLWDATTGKEVRHFDGHLNAVAMLAFAPDGKMLASRGVNDFVLRLHDVASGKTVREIIVETGPPDGLPPGAALGGKSMGITCLAFAPDNQTVAALGPNNTLCLWDTTTGKEVRRLALAPQQLPLGLVFSPDGRALAGESLNQTITLWEVATGKERGHCGAVLAGQARQPLLGRAMVFRAGLAQPGVMPVFAFAPDGRSLAVRQWDHSIRLWDTTTGEQRGDLKGHQGAVLTLAFAADGKTLASGSSDTTALLWDVSSLIKQAQPAAGALTARELDDLWADLAGGDAAKAFQGVYRLAAAPEQAVPYLATRLRPAVGAEARKIDQLVRDLDSDDFAVRQKASEELKKLGELAEPALAKVLKQGPSLEIRKRVEELLEQISGRSLSTEQVRLVRALEVLEHVDNTAARQLLQTLTKGAPGTLPTREAQLTLERMKRRTAAR